MKTPKWVYLVIIAAVVLFLVFLNGCSALNEGGAFTGDQKPDAYAKVYCFDGFVDASAGAAVGGVQGTGKMTSNGILVFGDLPDDAIVSVANQGCDGSLGQDADQEPN